MENLDQRFTEVLDVVVDGELRGRDVIGAFMRLSSILVGPAPLKDWVGRAYLGTLLEGATAPGAAPQNPEYRRADIRAVLERFEQIERAYGAQPRLLEQHVQSELVLSPEAGVANVTKSIAALWYCAGLIEFQSPMNFMTRAAPKETYATALAWQAVGGNPMGVPGPYYGNWSYPSPTLIQKPEPEESVLQAAPAQKAAVGS
jgi:hypothetical protein